jgi:peroxiredoxin
LQRAGGTVLAIANDPIPQCRQVHQANGLPFAVLSDVKLEAITAFGVLHQKGPRGKPIALPANFLIDADGRLRWSHVSRRVQDRVDPAELMQQVRQVIGQ